MPKSKVDNTPNGEDSTPKGEDKPHKGDHRKGEHKSRHKKSKSTHKKHGPNIKKSRRRELDGAVELYCAVYIPESGNYYHWAFVMYHSDLGWCLYEVVQQADDGPFAAVFRQADPRSSTRCHALIHLGSMQAAFARQLPAATNQIAVPREAASWNCQDCVLEIWDAVLGIGAIGEVTWQVGRNDLMLYYGPVQDDQDENEEEEEEEEGADEEGQAHQYQSAEFVYDSGSD